jgi:uncharacterized membrane protein (GlpM family)
MTSFLWLPLLTKAASTALLVVLASATAERLGPFWGALVASLPVSTGPAYVFLALQHDPGFLAASALSSFAAHPATALFLVTYGLLARHTTLWRSLGPALLAWLAGGYAILQFTWTPLSALVLNVIVYAIGLAVLRPQHPAPGEARPAPPRRWYELPARAVAVALFVTLVVLASSLLGPQATGLVAIFPIGMTCLAIILHPRLGGAATSLMVASSLRAMLGFGGMILVVHLAIEPLGVVAAMLAGLLVSLSWSAWLMLRHRGATR